MAWLVVARSNVFAIADGGSVMYRVSQACVATQAPGALGGAGAMRLWRLRARRIVDGGTRRRYVSEGRERVNDDQANVIFLAAPPAANVAGLDAAELARLAKVAHAALTGAGLAGGIDADDLLLVTAMCWLAPRTTPPPEPLRYELLAAARRYDLTDPGRLLELTAAFGGGWGRGAVTASVWNGVWNSAVEWLLKHRIERSIDATLRSVASLGLVFPPGHHPAAPDVAGIIAAKLLRRAVCRPVLGPDDTLLITCEERIAGAGPIETIAEIAEPDRSSEIPAGAAAIYTCVTRSTLHKNAQAVPIPEEGKLVVRVLDGEVRVRALDASHAQLGEFRIDANPGNHMASLQGPTTFETWACTCGHPNCGDLHNLCAWDPRTPLADFLTIAFRGGRGAILAKAFEVSLLGAHLARDGW